MEKKTILLVCAAGFATTSMMRFRIEEALEERGIEVDMEVATVGKIPYYIDKTDLIVTTLSLEESDYDVPIIDGIPFLTGKGSSVVDEIVEELGLE